MPVFGLSEEAERANAQKNPMEFKPRTVFLLGNIN